MGHKRDKTITFANHSHFLNSVEELGEKKGSKKPFKLNDKKSELANSIDNQ